MKHIFLVRSAPPRIRFIFLRPSPAGPSLAWPFWQNSLDFFVRKMYKFCVKIVHCHFAKHDHEQFSHKKHYYQPNIPEMSKSIWPEWPGKAWLCQAGPERKGTYAWWGRPHQKIVVYWKNVVLAHFWTFVDLLHHKKKDSAQMSILLVVSRGLYNENKSIS